MRTSPPTMETIRATEFQGLYEGPSTNRQERGPKIPNLAAYLSEKCIHRVTAKVASSEIWTLNLPQKCSKVLEEKLLGRYGKKATTRGNGDEVQ